jgi:glycosyltransferase involved in cell wall biosynthesis
MNLLYVIAMYGPNYLGNLIHREIGHEFQKRGHSFSVFALAAERERRGQESDTREENIPVHRAIAAGRLGENALNALGKPFLHYDRFAAGWWHLRRYLAQHPELDLILAEGAYPFGALAALAAPRRPKLVVSVAGGDFIASQAANYGYGRFRTARWLMRRAFQRAAAVRVTTPLVRDHILRLGARPEQIALIPRNIASYCYPPVDQPLAEFRAAARRRLNTRYGLGNAHLVVAVGRLLPIKGFDKLVRAAPDLLQAAGDTCVMLIGPNRVDSRLGDYQVYLQKLGDELRVREHLIFAGAVPHPEMRDYLAAADVVAAPSVLEGMNKVVVEAAAVGTPSVVTRTAGIADLMETLQIGAIVDDPSPEALAQALVTLLLDSAQRAAMGARGVEFAQQFTSERIGAQLIELCERVL